MRNHFYFEWPNLYLLRFRYTNPNAPYHFIIKKAHQCCLVGVSNVGVVEMWDEVSATIQGITYSYHPLTVLRPGFTYLQLHIPASVLDCQLDSSEGPYTYTPTYQSQIQLFLSDPKVTYCIYPYPSAIWMPRPVTVGGVLNR